MSARQLLDQLLQSGQSLVKEATGHLQGAGGNAARGQDVGVASGQSAGDTGGALGGLGSLLGSGGKGGGLGSLLSGFGGGALSGSALTMLLSNKKMRKMGGSVAMMGGMAALGAVAYRAYSDWQRQQAGASAGAGGATPGGFTTGTATVEPHAAGAGQAAPLGLPEPQTLDRISGAQAEEHSNAVLVAMIGASKADGHIGPEEKQLLEGELNKLSADASDRAWLEAELAKPLDPAAVARSATTPEIAAEMYLASLLIVDEESYMERAYLDELARQMKLDPGLKATLEAQLKPAA